MVGLDFLFLDKKKKKKGRSSETRKFIRENLNFGLELIDPKFKEPSKFAIFFLKRDKFILINQLCIIFSFFFFSQDFNFMPCNHEIP